MASWKYTSFDDTFVGAVIRRHIANPTSSKTRQRMLQHARIGSGLPQCAPNTVVCYSSTSVGVVGRLVGLLSSTTACITRVTDVSSTRSVELNFSRVLLFGNNVFQNAIKHGV